MRLIRLDGWGPDGSDLHLDPRVSVLLGVPATTAAALIHAVRALGDPMVGPPVGLVEVDRTVAAIAAYGSAPGADPVVELRAARRPPPLGVVASGSLPVDPGADARRRSARRIAELQAELAEVEAELRSVRARSAASDRGVEPLGELEAAADQLSLALLSPHADGLDEFCELEQRLRGLTHAADEASIRAEATTWRIEELRAEQARTGGSVEDDAERSVLVAELEAVRAELLELDRRGAVVSGERDRLATLRARAALLLDELGYDDYVVFLLEGIEGAPGRPGRRERVQAVRRELVDEELDRLRRSLPGEVDAHASLRERSRLQAEAAGLLGLDVETIRRLTVGEVADLLRERSDAPDADVGLGAAVGRLVRALAAVGAEPPMGSGDPIELLAAARRRLAAAAPAGQAEPVDPGPGASPGGVDPLEERRERLRAELAEQERLLDVLLAAVDGDDQLPVGVPLAGVVAGDAPAVTEVVQRAAALEVDDPSSTAVLPLVLLVDEEPPVGLGRRLAEVADRVQCLVVCEGSSSSWRAIGDDAGRVVEW